MEKKFEDYVKTLWGWLDRSLPDPNSYDADDYMLAVPPDETLPHYTEEIDPSETIKVKYIRFIKKREMMMANFIGN